jgi:O-antigen ligase
MTSSLRQAIAPIYLFLCIVMGGSAQGIFSNLALQLAGVAILAWAFVTREPLRESRAARQLSWLAASAVGLVALQLVPLPPAIWSNLPGREFVVEGYRLLGQPLPWMPLSLAPAETIATAASMLPPLAMLALILRLGAYRASWLIIALLLATIISVGLGVVQLQSGGPYLYPLANLGTASGVFANANHMATLLLVSIPFVMALAARRWRRNPKSNDRLLTATLAGGAAVVVLLGMATNQSFALLIIGGPVVGAALLQLVPPGRVRLGRLAAVLGLLLLAGTAALAVLASSGMSAANRDSVNIRTAIWTQSAEVVGDSGLAGTGIGTFPQVYRQYEDPATIERVHVNHAHNDYLEVIIEAGLAGLALMALFTLWWVARALAIWRSPNSGELARAACIASAAVLLHSLVDFPLRTAAIATVLAMALALMADPARRRYQVKLEELRPTRHLTL